MSATPSPIRPKVAETTLHVPLAVPKAALLFGPFAERAWAAGWAPTPLWPADEAEPVTGTAFVVDEPVGRAYWTLAEYAPDAGRLRYVKNIHDLIVSHLSVDLIPAAGGGSEARMRYRLFPLSPAGEEYSVAFAASLPTRAEGWQERLVALASGSGAANLGPARPVNA